MVMMSECQYRRFTLRLSCLSARAADADASGTAALGVHGGERG